MNRKQEETNPAKETLELSLVDSWAQSLVREDLESILKDSLEVALDAILDDGLLKEIPVVSTAVSVYKIGHAIKERHYIRKLVLFLYEIRSGNIDEKTKQQYIQRITKDKRSTQRELEYLLILLDRMISERKVLFLAKIYLAYIRNEVDWTLFCKLSEVIDHLLPGDEECLKSSVLEDGNRNDMDNCAMLRLQGLGIVEPIIHTAVYDIDGNAIATRNDGIYTLTTFGNTLSTIIMA